MALAYAPGAELPTPYPRPRLRIDPVTRDAALARVGRPLTVRCWRCARWRRV